MRLGLSEAKNKSHGISGLYSVKIGCFITTNYVPNWVTISMMALSRAFALESPIWSIHCVPNWVHYGLHPIGYNKSYTNDILKAG